ncbi:MAG: glycosyltransferase [Candidatus Nanopelagicales bacterium]
MKPHDVAFLTFDSIQEGVGASQVERVVRELARIGIDIALVSFEKARPSAEATHAMRDAGVSWTPLPFGAEGAAGGLRRIAAMRWSLPAARLLHCRSDLPVAVGRMTRTPYVWDVRSLWADQRAAIGSLRFGGPEYRVLRSLERAAYRGSAGMVTLTRAAAAELADRYGRYAGAAIVVPTCADLDAFTAGPLPGGDVVRLLLAGTYNDYYDLALMEGFVAELRDRGPVEVTWARPAESPRSAIRFADRVVSASSATEMAALIRGSHAGLGVCRADAGPSLTAALPTKIAEFLACGRPVVVNPGLGDCDELVESAVLVDARRSSLAGDADRLRRLLADPALVERCRAQAEREFSLADGSRRLADLYEQVLAAG